jgi:hypothetical protein
MFLKLPAEMPDGTGNRPGRRISERTNGIPFNILRNPNQEVYVTHPALAVFQAVQHFFHPSCAFAAG